MIRVLVIFHLYSLSFIISFISYIHLSFVYFICIFHLYISFVYRGYLYLFSSLHGNRSGKLVFFWGMFFENPSGFKEEVLFIVPLRYKCMKHVINCVVFFCDQQLDISTQLKFSGMWNLHYK